MPPDSSFLRTIYEGLRDIAKKIAGEFPEERSTSISSIYQQVANLGMSGDDWMWLIDLYTDENSGELFAIFSKEGLLYRASVSLSGDIASLGAMVEVQQYFQPTQRSHAIIRRQADNSIRWFLQASSAVLNRNGAIDSTQLFDNIIKRARESGKYPYLTFCHLGKLMKMGMTDWMDRDEKILLASGTFDKDNVIADHMISAYEKDPEYWGSSISFWPLDGRMELIAEGVSVPMYIDGESEEISILPESMACCLFTALHSERKVENMKKEVEDAIRKLMGDDTALADKIVQTVDSDNKTIAERGLISREKEEETPAQSEPPIEKPAEETKEEAELEVDDNTLSEIVSRVAKDPQVVTLFQGFQQSLSDLRGDYKQLVSEFNEFRISNQASSDKIASRLHTLEKSSKELQDEWVGDLPRAQGTIKVVHRAKSQNSGEEPSLSDRAEDTLSKLK